MDEKRFSRLGWGLVLLGFVGFLLWAGLAPLDKGVGVSGTVMVAGSRKAVQHPTGGLVRHIRVHEGERVEAGQVLLEMDATQARAQADGLFAQYLAALASLARLSAERDEKARIEFPAELLALDDPRLPTLLEQQRQLHDSRRRALRLELDGLAETVAGSQAQLDGLQAALRSKEQQRAALEEQLRGLRQLASEGYVPRNRLLDSERLLAQVNGEIAGDLGSLGSTRRQILELRLRMAQRREKFQEEVRASLADAQVITVPAGVQEGLDAIRRADAYALLYIPPDFEADVLGGRAPKAELYYNALLYSAGYAATQDFSALVASLNGELRPRLAAGMPAALPHLASISVSYDSLFNASGNYIYYQQFAAIVHLLQLFVIVTMVHVLAREAPELRASSPHILRAKALGVRLVGKLAPYTLLFTALLMLEIFLLVAFSGARINGSPLAMLMITLFYVIAAQSVGLVLFVFTANRFTAYSLVGMLIGVAQTYSGVLIPELAMPTLARVIAEAEPLTHTLHGLFDQFLRQAPPSSALYTCAKLALYPLIAYMIAKMRLRSRLDLSPI
ncbi:HlyD family type I secretion periplasmic adaptor subunit [Pseudomonas aeruginosa]|nr:HlyD family type I secretion periplasmic adaptor subunit [Pseudomonas aeruginosa]TQG06164.1 HlyD family type I secretion periplasmic adaptor subunit [Pseudomonas aeruginosa]TQG15328.1 HlyD family type I secretion periplasmic adaptor subunit [Pseudomonas aeruginosa]TQG26838.1 HlyD family type I secretion periplasmic adaptor subunit [Pseudomonas aeruginosa]